MSAQTGQFTIVAMNLFEDGPTILAVECDQRCEPRIAQWESGTDTPDLRVPLSDVLFAVSGHTCEGS